MYADKHICCVKLNLILNLRNLILFEINSIKNIFRTRGARFTKQGKLVLARNSIKAPMGGENSAGDLLTMRTLKIQSQPLVNPYSIILTPEDGLRWRNLLVNLAQELFP